MRRFLVVCLAILALAAPAAAQRVRLVERGDPLRATLLDAARPTFERETGGPVEFVVRRLATSGGWAYAAVVAQRPGGGGVDWRRTPHRAAFEGGAFGDVHMALIRREGGAWRLVDHVVGPTDVAWLAWAEEHRLPHALFE